MDFNKKYQVGFIREFKIIVKLNQQVIVTYLMLKSPNKMSATKKKNKFLRSLTCDLIPIQPHLTHGTKVNLIIFIIVCFSSQYNNGVVPVSMTL